MPIVFAAISPHPPLLLPNVGTNAEKLKVKNTIQALEGLGKKLSDCDPDKLIVSSPHADWGFDVPIFFLAPGFSDEASRKNRTEYLLATLDEPKTYFEKGIEVAGNLDKNKKYALIASGDMSHCLKKDGPYGFHPDGPKFDQMLIDALKKKDIETILKLNDLFQNAGECGLRSFCFVLGILEGAKIIWQPKILSYEAPFGVGYLVVNFKID